MTPKNIISEVISRTLTFFDFINLNWNTFIPSHELSELYEEIIDYRKDDGGEFWINYKIALIDTLESLLKPQ